MKIEKGLTIRVVGSQIWDPEKDNLDVEVRLPDGRRFGAAFFTIRSVQALFEKNVRTGEYARGLYFWTVNMIIVRELTMGAIEGAVQDLVASGDLETAFSPLDTRGEDASQEP